MLRDMLTKASEVAQNTVKTAAVTLERGRLTLRGYADWVRRFVTECAEQLPKGREHRAQRRAYWSAVRVILRYLGRMVARRARGPRYAAQVPPPLYTRPAPPAAPLAPPALA